GLDPARDPDRQRRWHALRRAALAEPGELGDGGARLEGRRALHTSRRQGPAGGGHPRPGPGPLLRAEIALRRQGPGPRRRACRPARDGEGASEWEGLHHRGPRGDGAQGDAGRRKTRGDGHRRDCRRRPQPRATRYPDDPRGNRQDRPALHRRGEPAALRLGCRDRLDRGRRVLRRPGWPHRPHHDPARAAAGGRRARGCGHAVGGADGADGAKINEMTPVTELISVRHTDLYINGSWGPASDRQRIDVQDPATGEVIATVASASVQDALGAVQAAADAFRPWAARPPRQRAEILRKGFELMIRDQDRLAELMVRANGKPMVEARGEVAYAAEFFRWFSEEAVRNIGSVSISPSGANRILVEHQPIGVSVLVTPWNFPAAMATRKIGPALAAGCSVILKPASETPLTALAVADLLEQAGVPKGVVNVIPSKRSSEVVKAMLKDPRVRKLSFTGSTEVGRILLAQAAESVISCS